MHEDGSAHEGNPDTFGERKSVPLFPFPGETKCVLRRVKQVLDDGSAASTSGFWWHSQEFELDD